MCLLSCLSCFNLGWLLESIEAKPQRVLYVRLLFSLPVAGGLQLHLDERNTFKMTELQFNSKTF